MEKNREPRSGIREEHPENVVVVLGLTILKFLDADPNPGSGILSTLDSGSGIRDAKTRIRDPR
jgi:hypothetical protein